MKSLNRQTHFGPLIFTLCLVVTQIAAFLDLKVLGIKGKPENNVKALPDQEIKYYLRDRSEQKWVALPKDGSVPNEWNKDEKVKVIIHDYQPHSHDRANNHTLEEAMKVFKEQNVYDIAMVYSKDDPKLNVILVDWLCSSGPVNVYAETLKAVSTVGKHVSDVLINIEKEGHIRECEDVHLIGFGVGAHIAGVAGKNLKGHKYGRITGLDPMGPGFDDTDSDGKKFMDNNVALTNDDAAFVDVIHCNMGNSKDMFEAQSKGRYGSSVKSGHVDFYPNGGETQKDCTDAEDLNEAACSHKMCPLYFAKSINKMTYLACLCDDYDTFKKDLCECTEKDGEKMGDKCSKTAKGKYYLTIKK